MMRTLLAVAALTSATALAGPTTTTPTGPVVVPPTSPFIIAFEMSVCSAFPSPPCYLETLDLYRDRSYDGGVGPWGPSSGMWAYYPYAGVVTFVDRTGSVFSGWARPTSTAAGQRCFSGTWQAPPTSTGMASGTWSGCTVP